MTKEIFHNKINETLFHYQELIVGYARRGLDGREEWNCSTQWSFAGAFLYSLTVITTIGEYRYFLTMHFFRIFRIFRTVYYICFSQFIIFRFVLFQQNYSDINSPYSPETISQNKKNFIWDINNFIWDRTKIRKKYLKNSMLGEEC